MRLYAGKLIKRLVRLELLAMWIIDKLGRAEHTTCSSNEASLYGAGGGWLYARRSTLMNCDDLNSWHVIAYDHTDM